MSPRRIAPRRLLAPILSSLRTQVIVALVLTLVIAIGVTAMVDRQITETRLRAQAQMLLERDLEVLAQLAADMRSEQLTGLRNAAQNLQVLGLTAATPSARLRQVAVDTRRQLAMDGIALVASDGRILAGVGVQPDDVQSLVGLPAGASGSQIVADPDGGLVEASTVYLSADLWLLGSRRFGDTTAFAFRRVVGNDVVLLHHGEVRGSTLSTDEALGAIVAAAPDTVEVLDNGQPSLAGFTSLGAETQAAVVTPRLLAGLQRDLTLARLVSLMLLMLMAVVIGSGLIRRITRPLVMLSQTADAVRRGETDRTFQVDSGDEIGRLGQTLESMRRSLGDQLAVISVQAEAIRKATQRIVTARDVERRRMAQDLHDGVQQQLVMLRLRIGLMDDHTTRPERDALGREVESVIQQLRETGQAIYPSILSDRGLGGALYSLAASSPVPIEVDLQEDPVPRLGEAVEAGAYFIIAEATTNALKHADAGRIIIRIRWQDTAGGDGQAIGRSLLVVVVDDGQGFDVDAGAAGTGLQNLHDRAVALGGVAHVRSVPGRGTAVVVSIPLRPTSIGGPLQKEQHRRDSTVEVIGIAQAQLPEDGVGVLLNGPFPDDQVLGDA